MVTNKNGSKLKVVTRGKNDKWSKLKVVKKWSKHKIVKIKMSLLMWDHDKMIWFYVITHEIW